RVRDDGSQSGAPGWIKVIGYVACDLKRRAAGNESKVNLSLSSLLRDKGNGLAIGRDGRKFLEAPSVGQSMDAYLSERRRRTQQKAPRDECARREGAYGRDSGDGPPDRTWWLGQGTGRSSGVRGQ